MVYEVRDDDRLLASTTAAATALLLAREWLRDSEERGQAARTCVVQMLEGGELVGEHIVALADRPL